MRFLVVLVALILNSCGSDDGSVGGTTSPTGDGGNRRVTIDGLSINARFETEPVTEIKLGSLKVSGVSSRVVVSPADAAVKFPLDLSKAASLKISSPDIKQCQVSLVLKMDGPKQIAFEFSNVWQNEAQRLDCCLFEAKMRQDGFMAELTDVTFGEGSVIKSVGILFAPNQI